MLKLNLNRANRNAIMSIVVLIAIIFLLGLTKNTSRYQPRPITIKAINEKSLFDLYNQGGMLMHLIMLC